MMEFVRGVAVIILLTSSVNSQEYCSMFKSSNYIEDNRPIFFVNIECTSQKLKVNWWKESYDGAQFSANFLTELYITCTDSLGKKILDKEKTQNDLNGQNGSLSYSVKNNIISTCVAYGCHSFYSYRSITENSTCTLQDTSTTLAPTVVSLRSTEEITSSIPALRSFFEISTTYALTMVPVSTRITEEIASSMPAYSSSFDISSSDIMELSPTPTQSQTLATVIPTTASPPTTSQWIQPHVSTRTPSSALLLPLPEFKKSYNSHIYLLAFGLVGLLVVILLGTTGCAFLSYYVKARRKRMKHLALHMWNPQYIEKTDLNFVTLEVDQRLKKHESTTSIIECLNLPSKMDSVSKEDVLPQQPIHDGNQQPPETTTLHYPQKFVLHAKELQGYLSHDLPDETISQRTMSSSHSQPYLANCEFTASQGQNQDVEQLASEVGDSKDKLPLSSIEISDYYRYSYEQKQRTASLTDSSEDSNSIFSDEVEEKASDYCSSFPVTNNCVVLKFAPSSLANSNEVIYFDSLPSHSDDEHFCEEITEQNFYIDPRHFNPI